MGSVGVTRGFPPPLPFECFCQCLVWFSEGFCCCVLFVVCLLYVLIDCVPAAMNQVRVPVMLVCHDHRQYGI